MDQEKGCIEPDHDWVSCDMCAYEDDKTGCKEYRREYKAKMGYF